MKHCFIINPHARNGRGRKKVEELRAELERCRLRYTLAFCEGLDHACELSREANLSGYDVITGVGGDGTINRVLNGFFDSSGHRISQARMGAVHIGTSPDFCRSYGVPTKITSAIEALATGLSCPVSVGRILYEAGNGSATATGQRSACFGCCANVGLGPSLARLANAGIRKHVGDFLGTFISLLQVLVSFRPRDLRIELDGHERTVPGVYNIAVGKTLYIASGIKIRHELSRQDSRFYVLCLRNLSWRNIGHVLHTLYTGRPITADSCLSLEYARSAQITPTNGPVEVEFDGDPAGWCPCRIETARDPLDLIVGESA